MRTRNLSTRLAAEKIGVLHSHLGNALNGRTAPSDKAREGLSKLLALPVEELFTPELLARFYTGPRGRSGGRRPGGSGD
jgi:transcriptional regulator with XRE-family HTH domain